MRRRVTLARRDVRGEYLPQGESSSGAAPGADISLGAQRCDIGGTMGEMPFVDFAKTLKVARVPLTVRSWLWLCLPLILMGTDCPDRPPQPPPTPPPPPLVASVEIVPPVVHAEVGSAFELLAIARAADNSPLVNPGPYSWSSANTELSSKTENKTVVSGFSAGTHRIELTVGGKTASMELRVAPAAVSGDRVRMPHTNGNPVAVVLIDATDNGSKECYHDLIYRVSATALLNENLTTDDACVDRMTAFDINRGVRFDLAQLWTPNSDDKGPALPEPLVVDVVAWYRVSESGFDPVAAAKAEVAYTNSIYAARRAGMVFQIVADQGGVDGSTRDFIVNTTDPDPCSGAATQLGIDPIRPGTLNIVYVKHIMFGEDAGVRGLACAGTDGQPRILIISRLRMLPSTLAHELAHLMGLSSATFSDWRGGHTTFLDTFDPTNLMWSQENATVGLPRDNLSLGQVFRMNVDKRSWVNVEQSGVTPPKRIRIGDTLLCQSSRDTQEPCPKLALDVGKP